MEMWKRYVAPLCAFETAKKYSRQAVELGSEVDDVKAQLEKELESYEQGKPWREKQELEEAELAGLAPVVAKASSDDDDDDDDDKDDAAPTPRRPF